MKKILDRTKLLICLLILFSQFAMAQDFGTKVGDRLPDLGLSGKVVAGDQPLGLADLYRKGGLIINFWATWCIPCLREQKLLDSLLYVHPDLSVISTSYEQFEAVNAHFNKVGFPKSRSMFINAEEKTLHDYFKHLSIPHNIWINNKGIITAITSGEDINEKNVSDFLKGKAQKLLVKNDDVSFDFRKTYHVPDSMIRYRSYITDFNDRITSGVLYGVQSDSVARRIFCWNRPIVQLFWLAYNKQQRSDINWNLVELHTSDSVRFYQPQLFRALFDRSRYANGDDYLTRSRKWERDNLYCYELILQRGTSLTTFSNRMFQDLGFYFNIKVSTEDRKMLVHQVSLSRIASLNLPLSKDSLVLKDGFDGNVLSVKDCGMDRLFTILAKQFQDQIPYVNNTGYDGKLSFVIKGKGDKLTLDEVWVGLNKLGIKKVDKQLMYPVLVLRDLTSPAK